MKKIHQLLAFFNGSKKSHKPNKKEVQLQYNSTTFFLLGIIVISIGVWVVVETNFKVREMAYEKNFEPKLPDEDFYFTINLLDSNEKQQEEVKKVKKKVVQNIKPIENNQPLNPIDTELHPDTGELPDQPQIDTNPEPITNLKPEDHSPKHINTVELVPVFPGCETLTDNTSRLQCMSAEIHKIINRRFNHSIIERLGVERDVRIYVNFVVDKSGNVTQIEARSPYPQLEKEAERVIEFIPQLMPAIQNNKPVNVLYNIPIVIQVH